MSEVAYLLDRRATDVTGTLTTRQMIPPLAVCSALTCAYFVVRSQGGTKQKRRSNESKDK